MRTVTDNESGPVVGAAFEESAAAASTHEYTSEHPQTDPAAPPTWDDVVVASIEGQRVGYRLGYAHGLRAAADQLDAEVLVERANKVIRGVVADMDVPAARERADLYEDAQAPAQRWSA